jgi:elongation factor 3
MDTLRRHMDKTPNEYIRWRYAGGEDREAIAKDTMKISDAELELQKTVH